MGVRCLSVFVSVLLFLFVCLLIWLVLGLLRVVVFFVFCFFGGGMHVGKCWLYKRQVEMVSRV